MLADLLPAFPNALVEGDTIWLPSVGVRVGRMHAGHERNPCGLVVCRRTWPPQSRLCGQRHTICIRSQPWLPVWCQIIRRADTGWRGARAIRSDGSRGCERCVPEQCRVSVYVACSMDGWMGMRPGCARHKARTREIVDGWTTGLARRFLGHGLTAGIRCGDGADTLLAAMVRLPRGPGMEFCTAFRVTRLTVSCGRRGAGTTKARVADDSRLVIMGGVVRMAVAVERIRRTRS